MGMVGFLIVLALVILVLGGAVQWPRDRNRSLKADPAVTVRLARIENSLRLLESRLDSLQEQQQFLERLLGDRSEPRTLPQPKSPADDEEETSILFDLDPPDADGPDDREER